MDNDLMKYDLDDLAAALDADLGKACASEKHEADEKAPAADQEGYVTTNLAAGKDSYRQLDAQVRQLKKFNQYSPQLW